MIKIDITQNNDEIKINGHAEYDDSGKDIVCASVSSIVITTINAILRIDNKSIDYTETNGVYIKVLKHTEIVDKLITNMIELLSELEKQYSKYIILRRC